MKVRGWLADESACGWYRMKQPFEALRGTGFCAVEAVELTGNEMIEADVTVVQRTCSPIPVYLMETAKKHGARFIYEVDDLLTHVDPANPVAAHYADPLVRAAADYAIDMAEAITVSTRPLAQEMAAVYDKPVHVLPNYLAEYFTDIGAKAARIQRDEDAPQIVWAGSATHHGDFIPAARYGLTRAVKWTGSLFTCVGHDYRRQLGVDGTLHGWSESIPAFHDSLIGFDIGLCPLAGTRFNESKSGIKAIEYQAAGIVPVASDCAPYQDVIIHGETGFLCRTQEDWKDAICGLARDAGLRDRMRAACLELTPGRLASANAHRWRAVYEAFRST